MKKQSGFTLIELMVVMAIIAILATAGLSAYTGYIKKARDTTRIADINAINTIVLGSLSVDGQPPQTAAALHQQIVAANNGKGVYDPLSNQTDGTGTKFVCLGNSGTTPSLECSYTFRLCDNYMGYAIGARFESKSNATNLYSGDDITIGQPVDPNNPVWGSLSFLDGWHDDDIYEIGSCITAHSVSITNYAPAKIWSPYDNLTPVI